MMSCGPLCYHKTFDDRYIILLLYVDDMLVTGSSIHEINNLKKQLSKEFEIDLGATKQILKMRITRDRKNHELRFSSTEYVEKVLSRFNIQDAKPLNTPLASHFRLKNIPLRLKMRRILCPRFHMFQQWAA